MMMVNMDPPLHTRYRRLVNKGFTPRMIRDLEAKVVASTDSILDAVCEQGSADFVEQISAELPLQVIADLVGVPQEDRHLVFDWSNRMVGADDPEYQVSAEAAGQAAMELFAYADQLTAQKRLDPHADLLSVLTQAELDGDSLSQLELDLFFMLLSVAGNETTRNLISGAMVAFFDHPDQWERLRADRSLLESAVEEMLRFVSPVMHFRRQATSDVVLGDQKIAEGDKVVFWHISANRDETVFADPDTFDIGRTPNNHMAFGGGGPHFCLGRQPGPHGDPGHVRPAPRPHARHPPRRRRATPALQLHQRGQAHPGGVRPVRTRRRLVPTGRSHVRTARPRGRPDGRLTRGPPHRSPHCESRGPCASTKPSSSCPSRPSGP